MNKMSDYPDATPQARTTIDGIFNPKKIKARKDRDTSDNKPVYKGSFGANDIAIYPDELVFYIPETKGMVSSNLPQIFSNFVGLTEEEAKRAIFLGVVTGSGKTPDRENKWTEFTMAIANGGVVSSINRTEKTMPIGSAVAYELPSIDSGDGRHLARFTTFSPKSWMCDESDFIRKYKNFNLDKNVRDLEFGITSEMIKKMKESTGLDEYFSRILLIRRHHEEEIRLKSQRVIGMITRGAEKGGKFDFQFGRYSY